MTIGNASRSGTTVNLASSAPSRPHTPASVQVCLCMRLIAKNRAMCRIGALLAFVALASPPEARSPLLPGALYEDPCSACDLRSHDGARPLQPASVDSLGAAYATHNFEAIRAADMLFSPDSEVAPRDAADRARAFVQLRAWDGIRLVVEMAGDSEGYVPSGEDALAPLGDRYPNAAVYPARFIRGGFIGKGVFCLDYALPARHDQPAGPGEAGGRLMRREVKLPRRGRVPVILRQYPMADGDAVDLIFESRVCGRAARARIEDRGDSLVVDVIHDLRGMYVRKFGVHKLGALAVWRSVVRGNGQPHNPRFGACAYFPRLSLELPLFLPDIGVDDLRDFGYPQPLMSREWFLQPERLLFPWLGVIRPGVFSRWNAAGPRPRILAEWFPDL